MRSIRDGSITVAVDEAPEEGLEQPLRLEKLANEVTYQRLSRTLGTLAKGASGGSPGAPLVDIAFGSREPRRAAHALMHAPLEESGSSVGRRGASGGAPPLPHRHCRPPLNLRQRSVLAARRAGSWTSCRPGRR